MKEFFLSILAALGVANTPAPAVTDDTTTPPATVEDNSTSSDSTMPTDSTPAPALTREQAIAKAMEAVAGEGETLGRVELENEDGVLVWKVRLATADGRGADVRVNAGNGNIERLVVGGAVLVRNSDSDDDNDDDRRGRGEDDDDNIPADVNTEVTRDEAIDIAKNEVPGDNESVERVELENEDGILVWKVRLVTSDGGRADVRVNAESGDVERLRIREDDNRGRGFEISSEQRSDRAELRARNGDDNSRSRIREERREDRSEVRREDRREDRQNDDSRGGENRGRGSERNDD